MDDALLRVEGLSKQFGGVNALRRLSFQVQRGEIFTIIGPNGAGKTTLFNCLSGIHAPDQGRIFFDGRDITHANATETARLGLARSFQNLELFAGMTTLENLLPGRHRHMKTNLWQGLNMWRRNSFAALEELANRERVAQIIAFLGLEEVQDRPVDALPYGTRKWIELGRALATEPRLLLLDEPAAGMSAGECQTLFTRIHQIRRQWDITILIIEHNLNMVMSLSDRILALNFGREIVIGTPAEITAHPEVIRAWMGA